MMETVVTSSVIINQPKRTGLRWRGHAERVNILMENCVALVVRKKRGKWRLWACEK
jgi:hypothetical protein